MDIKIALAGNPNCGKTTLFNALTGSNQYVGNWPGVTVEKKEGRLKGQKDVIIQDLPGIYSLSPYTLEEVIARNYLINEKPDAILNIVDYGALPPDAAEAGAQPVGSPVGWHRALIWGGAGRRVFFQHHLHLENRSRRTADCLFQAR